MKKLKTIFMVFCMFLVLCPMDAKANEAKSKYFNVNLDIGEHGCIAPNDYFFETFTIQNKTNEIIKVRVYDVSNIDDSTLYPVLQARWIDEDMPADIDASGNGNLGSFDDLVTDWCSISSGDSLEMKLEMYCPKELGNEYQNAELKASFTFECMVPEGKSVEIKHVDTKKESRDITNDLVDNTNASIVAIDTPNTWDDSGIERYMMLGIISAILLIGLLMLEKRKQT